MTTPQDIEAKFWKALRSDMTMMLGVDGEVPGRSRPMTAQIDGDEDRGPIWFFGTRDSHLAAGLSSGRAASGCFVSKGHDIFATVHGQLQIANDRAVIDRLWNPFVAAWYQGGKDDPNLALFRFDAADAEIWLDGSSLLAGIRMLFGADPKVDYRDKVAKVSLA